MYVDDIVTRACKRAWFKSGEITSEVAEIALQNLYLLLSEIANHGVTLWTQSAVIVPTVPNKLAYDLPDGTVDIKDGIFYSVTLPGGGTALSTPGGSGSNAFDYTDVTVFCTQTAPNGEIMYDFGTVVTCPIVGIMANGTADYDLIWSVSQDNVTYTDFYVAGLDTYENLLMSWASINAAPYGRYFKVREVGGATLNINKVVFGQNPTGLPMNRMNRDDYSSLPNPTQSGTQTLQYFVQRLINAPQALTWPVPQSYFNYFLFWSFRQIMDVGDLTNTIEVPQRWQEAITASLAFKMAMEYPEKVPLVERQQLATYAASKMKEAEEEERDDSPIFLGPNITAYTS